MTRFTRLDDLFASLPQVGEVAWIGVRPERRAPMQVMQSVEAQVGTGLVGDRFSGDERSKRQVTLIQMEHLEVVGRLLHGPAVSPEILRRNIGVRGINLLALVGARFSVGGALLEGSGRCDPCSWMEEALGPGGYNAVRGHGGITARVIEGGRITVGDAVTLREAASLRGRTGQSRTGDLFS
jgi:MOSC domain-containing protein YiiM